MYLALLKGATNIVGLPGPYRFTFWSGEISRFPVYTLWIGSCLALVANRHSYPKSARLAFFAIAGFGTTALINALVQIRYLASISSGSPSVYSIIGWGLLNALMQTSCWAILLFALFQAWRSMAEQNASKEMPVDTLESG
jgi:hypothetical protein